jgi:hypothetical protein
LLREHLGGDKPLPQSRFARKLDVDAGTVSRWERGDLYPQPAQRSALISFARKARRNDLADAFRNPTANWRWAIQSNPMLANTLFLLELAALNRSALAREGEEDTYMEALYEIAAIVRDRLVERYKAGGHIVLMDDIQRYRWYSMLRELGLLRESPTTTVPDGVDKED